MRIRVRRPADHAVVVLRREAVTDPRLTLTAVGVMAVLAALPDDYAVTVSQLINRVGEDPVVVQAALVSLEAAGYLVMDPDLGPDGEAVLTDRPATTEPVSTSAGRTTQPPPQHNLPSQTAGAAPAVKQGDQGGTPRPDRRRQHGVEGVASEKSRVAALEQIRATLHTHRSTREREQALADAALRARLEAAAAARADAAAKRKAVQQTPAAQGGHELSSDSTEADRVDAGPATDAESANEVVSEQQDPVAGPRQQRSP